MYAVVTDIGKVEGHVHTRMDQQLTKITVVTGNHVYRDRLRTATKTGLNPKTNSEVISKKFAVHIRQITVQEKNHKIEATDQDTVNLF